MSLLRTSVECLFHPDILRIRNVLVFNVQIETKGLLLLFQIGITLHPVALHKNVYASVVEDMLLKVGACGQQRGCRGLKHHGVSWAGHTGSQAALKKGQKWNNDDRLYDFFLLIFKLIQL